MKHFATAGFWKLYRQLPTRTQQLADKNFALLKQSPRHPSLHFKQVGRFHSARVGANYRAVAVESDGDFVWVWIGTHADYNRLINT
jgi:hypothetical protein